MLNEKSIQNSFVLKKYFEYEINGLNKEWQGNFSNRMYLRFVILIKFLLNRPKLIKFGSWSDHVQYWTSQNGISFVKYEDLLQNTKYEMQRLLKELDFNIEEAKIDASIEKQSFEKKKKDFIDKNDIKNAKFMRNGEKESWKQLFSDKLYQKIIDRHGKIMNKFNYN